MSIDSDFGNIPDPILGDMPAQITAIQLSSRYYKNPCQMCIIQKIERLPIEQLLSTSITQASPSTSQIDSDLENIAHRILAETKQEITSTQDIISIYDLPCLRISDIPALYQRFGERLVKYSQLEVKIEQTREAVNLALAADIKYPITTPSIAISKFGIGDREEQVTLAFKKCNLLRQKCIKVLLKGKEKLTDSFNIIKKYQLILLGIEFEEFEILSKKCNDKFFELIKHLKKGVLLDPYLGLVCPLRELENKETELLRFLNKGCYTDIYDCNSLSLEDTAEYVKVEQDALQIYEKAQEILQSEASKKLAVRSKEFRKAILNCFAQDLIRELNIIFPNQNISWKKNCENDLKIWAEGLLEPIIQLKEKLEKLGIELTFRKVSQANRNPDEDKKYAVFLTHPSVDQLRQANNFLVG